MDRALHSGTKVYLVSLLQSTQRGSVRLQYLVGWYLYLLISEMDNMVNIYILVHKDC